MCNFFLYAKARLLAEHNIKDDNIFLYFEKTLNFVAAEIKNGKINILPMLPKLADFFVMKYAPVGFLYSKDRHALTILWKISRQKANNGRKLNYEKQNYNF